jgi:hypothetical protein
MDFIFIHSIFGFHHFYWEIIIRMMKSKYRMDEYKIHKESLRNNDISKNNHQTFYHSISIDFLYPIYYLLSPNNHH